MKNVKLLILLSFCFAIKAEAQSTTLHLKLFLEGLYIPNSQTSSYPEGKMNPAHDYIGGNIVNAWNSNTADEIFVE